MRILLVEDEVEMASYLARALKHGGFVADVANDARTAEGFLGVNVAYDAVVLDLGLPDASGLDVLGALRRRGDHTPVLVLTARGAIPDRVLALNSGADDFLAKPFAIEELEARLAALIRRSHRRADPGLRLGSLAYDASSRSFSLAGRLMSLTPREHAALSALLLRAGAPVGKSQLHQKVFPQDSDAGPDAIEQVLHRLRRKLAGADVRVVTVRGLGYLLEADEA